MATNILKTVAAAPAAAATFIPGEDGKKIANAVANGATQAVQVGTEFAGGDIQGGITDLASGASRLDNDIRAVGDETGEVELAPIVME